MFSFRAYFFNHDVYINGKNKYAAGEILTAYLNTDFYKTIEEQNYLTDLKKYKNKLILSEDMDYHDYQNYNSNVYEAAYILDQINTFLSKLPPYNKILYLPFKRIEDILNDYKMFFEDGLHYFQRENMGWDVVSEYGVGEVDEEGFARFRLHKFELYDPEEIRKFNKRDLEELQELNYELETLFDQYISFVESYLSVHKIFKPFIDDFLHCKETYLTQAELAKAFDEFNKTQGKSFQKIKCNMNSFRYKSLVDSSSNSILCEEIYFEDLQSFLYFDFFNGIKNNYIPNKCKHCGKYFLIKGGKYFCYCDNPLKDNPDKTCRDVGSRERYGNKCKNDPIWQTYNRAYKAHYARYMKKKMTISEFEEWSRFASDIRDKAIAEKISFDEYYTQIRK